MIHFTEYETDFVAVVTIFNQPEAIKRAQESSEAWVAIQFTIPGHGDALIYKDRETFLKLIDRAESQRAEILPHLQQWAKEKGLPPLSEFSTIVTFTSKMPAGTRN